MENDRFPTKFNHLALKLICVRKNNAPEQGKKCLFFCTSSSDIVAENQPRRQTNVTTFDKWKLWVQPEAPDHKEALV